MSKQIITVYHATPKGNGKKIERNGWIVKDIPDIGAVYGRGIYFWDLIEDAHTYGNRFFNGHYDIVAEEIPLVEGCYTFYDHNKRSIGDVDYFSQVLISRGIHCLIISRAYMDYSTMLSQGRAYVWLVDINQNSIQVNF